VNAALTNNLLMLAVAVLKEAATGLIIGFIILLAIFSVGFTKVGFCETGPLAAGWNHTPAQPLAGLPSGVYHVAVRLKKGGSTGPRVLTKAMLLR